jgi:hypothetical protein
MNHNEVRECPKVFKGVQRCSKVFMNVHKVFIRFTSVCRWLRVFAKGCVQL